jgi:tetratricopeptide (TPR) repeat protein
VWRDDIALWTKTVSVRPDDAPAFRNLTLSYLRLAEAETDPARARPLFEKAIEECRRGLEAGPDAGLLSNASSAYRSLAFFDPDKKQAHLETALDFARRAVERSELEPKPTKVAYLNLGFSALDLDRPAQAVAPFAWYADHFPEDPEAALRLAQTLKLAGRPRDALVVFAEAVKAAPDSPRVWMEKGDAHRSLGEKVEAIACFERAIKLAESLPPESREDPAQVESWRALLASLKKP